MHTIFRTDMIVYLLPVSEINLACSVINMALFFSGTEYKNCFFNAASEESRKLRSRHASSTDSCL
jgi:hypothetical protein